GDAVIFFFDPCALVARFHAPEFRDPNDLVILAYPFLHDEYRTTIIELYSQIDKRIDDKRDDAENKGDTKIHCSLQNIVDVLRMDGDVLEKPAMREKRESRAAKNAFIHLMHVDETCPAQEEVIEVRQYAFGLWVIEIDDNDRHDVFPHALNRLFERGHVEVIQVDSRDEFEMVVRISIDRALEISHLASASYKYCFLFLFERYAPVERSPPEKHNESRDNEIEKEVCLRREGRERRDVEESYSDSGIDELNVDEDRRQSASEEGRFPLIEASDEIDDDPDEEEIREKVEML